VSYLGPLRLQFSGQFQADPSTVNNDVRHYNNATFQPQFQQPQSGQFMNGWWAPEGGGAFRLVGCTVTMAGYADGTTSTTDPVVGLAVADANARVAGKIVDLDPQQQLTSEIWGLIVRLTDGNRDFFSGAFEVTPFSDIWWKRAQSPGAKGDVGASSFYQSVIGPVTWGDTSGSPFLRQLRAAAPGGMLSIKFNVDGYHMALSSQNFTLGRIAGTIGPASPDEPKRFVLGRQLFPQLASARPAGLMNFMPAVVDLPTIVFDPRGVYPMIDNPPLVPLPSDSVVARLSNQFDQSYTALLNALNATFNGEPHRLDAAIGIMYTLRLAAQALVATPIPGLSDVTAGPRWQFVAGYASG